jgi:uncharacterized protein
LTWTKDHFVHELTLAGQSVALDASGGLWWSAEATWLIADLHLGKAATFRRLGMPVPRGTTAETLSVLSALVAGTAARRVVFLGDFLHSAHAQSAETQGVLAQWRTAHARLDLTLVRGNHDNRAGDPPEALGIHAVNEPFQVGPFALCHHPQAVEGAYTLGGHWHPCARVAGRARDSLRLPCFWFGDEDARPVGVLPAFGGFTGMHPITQQSGDRVFVVADNAVRALPARVTARSPFATKSAR